MKKECSDSKKESSDSENLRRELREPKEECSDPRRYARAMFQPKKNEVCKEEKSKKERRRQGTSSEDVGALSSNVAAAKEDVSEPCSDLRRSDEAMFQPKIRKGKD